MSPGDTSSTSPDFGVSRRVRTRLHFHSSVSIRITSRITVRSGPAIWVLPVSGSTLRPARDHGRTQMLLFRPVACRTINASVHGQRVSGDWIHDARLGPSSPLANTARSGHLCHQSLDHHAGHQPGTRWREESVPSRIDTLASIRCKRTSGTGPDRLSSRGSGFPEHHRHWRDRHSSPRDDHSSAVRSRSPARMRSTVALLGAGARCGCVVQPEQAPFPSRLIAGHSGSSGHCLFAWPYIP